MNIFVDRDSSKTIDNLASEALKKYIETNDIESCASF